jgi:ABC-type polysaccharide/polyol phosphate transport system ATPase subunit
MSDIVFRMDKASLTYPQHRYEKKKGFEKVTIGPVTLDLHRGEVLGIIGRNGSGKSTMVRIMAGVFPPDTGEIEYTGSISLLAGVGVGFNNLFTGLENTYLYGSLMGWSRKRIDGMLDDIIDFSELDNHFYRSFRTYSSGMKARLGISVATAFTPDILIIDEVLGVGDQSFKEKSHKRVREMIDKSGTVVIISHSAGLMTKLCDRIALMHEGKIVFVGDPTEAYIKYKDIIDSRESDNSSE